MPGAAGLTHNKVSGVADTADTTLVQPQADWNDQHYFAGGNLGALLYQGTAGLVTAINSVASGQVLVSAGAGSVPAWSASPSLTALSLASVVTVGTDGTSNLVTTPPANGWLIAPNPNWGFGANPTDLVFMNSGGFSFTARANTNYTMFMAGDGAKAIYWTAPIVVLFNATGKKAQFQSSIYDNDNFVLGNDSFSTAGTGGANYRQTLSAFHGTALIDNEPGGALRLASGLGTGNATPGYVAIATTDAVASGQTRQTHTDRVIVNASGLMCAVPISPKLAATTLATAGAETYTAAQLLGGIILRDPAGAGRADLVPTAVNLLAALPNAVVGQAVEFLIRNTADAAETITVTTNTGATLSGTMTIAQNNTKRFTAVFTNVTAASEAYTLYSLGTVVH